MKITFPDGTAKEYKSGMTGLDIAIDISEGLARDSCAIKVNEQIQDLTAPINEDSIIEIFTVRDSDGMYVFRHSSAHLLAAAVKILYPTAKFGVGPPVDEGFYYDIDVHLTQEDLPKIEDEMKKLVNAKEPFTKEIKSKKDALHIFAKDNLKCELIEEKEKTDHVSIYKLGDFYDFCKGPHLPHVGMIKAFKITKLAGAYWKGDSKNQQLTRIYGISFPDKKQLKTHLTQIEEAEKRDHRKLGKELELIMWHEFSPGSPFFLGKGTIIYNELLKLMREEYIKCGYQEVITPQIYNKKLWEISGHWDHYNEHMFFTEMDGEKCSLKPMNCPSHALIFKQKLRSYNDLPLRIADFCMLHRNELKGVLGGLTRCRKFSQDDAHIFCSEDNVQPEVRELLKFVKYIYSDIFGFEYSAKLSTKPEKAMGDPDTWIKAEEALVHALDINKIKYETKPGDGAFYGPKIDFDIRDCLGREWQTATIQLDFLMPENFKLEYMGDDGTTNHRPVMIHRAILGSLERFIGVMIEHFGGKFPLWLSPVQIRILPITDKHQPYSKLLNQNLRNNGLRTEIDFSADSMNKKVRNAQMDHISLIITIGDKEIENDTVAVRTLDGKVKFGIKIDDFIKHVADNIKKRKLKIDF